MVTKIYGYYLRGAGASVAVDEIICMMFFFSFMVCVSYFKLPVNGHKLHRWKNKNIPVFEF